MFNFIRKKSGLGLSAFAGLVLAGCADVVGVGIQETNPDYDFDATTALARQTLAALQTPSIRENREYCGYIGLDANNVLRATEANRGDSSSCGIEAPPADWVIVASYHTHAGYDEFAFSEVPSSTDIEGDRDEGINGYVSTPGGRFWFVEGATATARLLCGAGCLKQDPLYQPGLPVANNYTLGQIRTREQS